MTPADTYIIRCTAVLARKYSEPVSWHDSFVQRLCVNEFQSTCDLAITSDITYAHIYASLRDARHYASKLKGLLSNPRWSIQATSLEDYAGGSMGWKNADEILADMLKGKQA